MALQLLWANKLSSVLTLLGVASVIAVASLVVGASTYVATKSSSYSSDVCMVSKMPEIISNSEDYRAVSEAAGSFVSGLPVCRGKLQALRRGWGAAGAL